jgi:hypothetical protein
MYRDELEAQRARLTTLEAELAETREHRRELEAIAAAARQARHQARRAIEGRRPGRGLGWLAAGLGLALCSTLVLGGRGIARRLDVTAVARASLADLEKQSAQVKARIAEAKRELEAELRRCTPAAPPPPTPQPHRREVVRAAMDAVRPAVEACYRRHQVKGTVFVWITFAADGRPTTIAVKGLFAGTPTGLCVEDAARGVRVPPFQGAPFTVTYPYILR